MTTKIVHNYIVYNFTPKIFFKKRTVAEKWLENGDVIEKSLQGQKLVFSAIRHLLFDWTSRHASCNVLP